jgi:hypothetical protein
VVSAGDEVTGDALPSWPGSLSWLAGPVQWGSGPGRVVLSEGASCLRAAMPHWSIFCLYCQGYIADALLECIPVGQRSAPAFRPLFNGQPGGALDCPSYDGLIGFDDDGQPSFRSGGPPCAESATRWLG